MKIVIAGGSGFVGRHLAKAFSHEEVTILSRHPSEGEHFWDPEILQLSPALVENADVVINLSGESITGRWTKEKMELIRDSRLEATQLLVDRLAHAPPKLYIGASAIGYYGDDRGDELLTEKSRSGHGYLAEVCREWEGLHAKLPESRVVLARFGVILGKGGGALAKMAPLFRLCLGAQLGSGQQWMSWVSVEDVCGICQYLIDHPSIEGAINVTAPNAVRNHEFTRLLGKAVKRPTHLLPIPKWFLRMALGEGAEVLLGSLKVTPEKLIQAGYQFKYPDLTGALMHIS